MQTRSSSRLVGDQSSNPTSSTNPNPKGHNRGHSKQRVEKSNLEEHFPPVVMMADQRTMDQLLQAPTEGYEDAIVIPAITADNFEGYEDAIVIPAITADNFELKHGLPTLVQNKQLFGHDKDDPHAHIHYFNKITSTLKFPNVPNTSIKLMLFPFSLEVNLSEMELKKILIEKMKGNKSIQRSDEQRNLYKALVEAYDADKAILDTYGDSTILKRRREDDDKEGPSTGSNQGFKRQKEGGEHASASTPSETATKGAGSQSRQMSASESAFAE
nr:reverse transcriptase domain-containing protein [Tanacetum cinerariifolium]